MPNLLHRRHSKSIGKSYLELIQEKAETSKVYASYLTEDKKALDLNPSFPMSFYRKKNHGAPGFSFNPFYGYRPTSM